MQYDKDLEWQQHGMGTLREDAQSNLENMVSKGLLRSKAEMVSEEKAGLAPHRVFFLFLLLG